jgi:hypothetical protein
MMAAHDRGAEEAVVRGVSILLAVLAIAGFATGASAGKISKMIRLAQTSTTTNCMMTCNSQAVSCQTACVVPATPPTRAATTTTAAATSNASASTSCLLNCSTQQLACQTACARASPSQ